MSRIVNIKGAGAAILARTILWHLRYYVTGRSFPLASTFQLTNRCNLRCIMCNIPNNPRQGVLPLEDFKGIAAELGRLGCCYASLSGGEVLTIPCFFDYLHAAKSHIPSVNTVTNGLLLDKGAAMEFGRSGVDSVSISLDGLEKTHEKTRAKKGAFSMTVEAIERLRTFAPGVRVVVNTVIAPWNIGELRELTLFVERLGVLHKFQPLNEHPSFEGQTRPYGLAGLGTFDGAGVEELIRFLLTRKNVVNSRYFLRSIPAYLCGGVGGGLFDADCTLPRYIVEFREDGRMYPCLGGLGWKGGYPVADGVGKVFRSAGYRSDVKRLARCRSCTKSYSVCYIEPRVTFPVSNFIRYRLLPSLTAN